MTPISRDERLFLKFKHLIREVERRLSYKLDITNDKNIEDLDHSDASPLKLVYPDYLQNPYLKELVQKVGTVFPKDGLESWTARCDSNINYMDREKRLSLSGYYMQLHTFKRGPFISFIFWSLVGLSVHKTNYDENLAMIIDFARIFGLSVEEIQEIAEIVSAFFGDPAPGYELKQREIKELFSSTYAYLTS